MKVTWSRWVVLGMVLLVVGCAHRGYVKSGDEAFERGSYEESLRYYRAAQDRRPNNVKIYERVVTAEKLVLEGSLEKIEEAVGQGDVWEAVEVGGRVRRLLQEPARLQTLEMAVEEAVLTQGWELVRAGEFSPALDLVDAHVAAFGEPLARVAELDETVRDGWELQLRAAARERFIEGLHGAAALYYAKADQVGTMGDGGAAAMQSMHRVLHFDGWGLVSSVAIEGSGQSAILDRMFGEGLPGAIVDSRESDRYGMEGVLEVSVGNLRFEEWEEHEGRSGEYQSGTRLVTNSAYTRKESEVAQAERNALNAERSYRDAQRELSEAERDLVERRRNDRPLGIAEGRVERAQRDLTRRQTEWERARDQVREREIELRGIPRQVEEPVYSTHHYEVTLQRARMGAEIEVSIAVPGRRFNYSRDLEASVSGQSERHQAQPVLGLAARGDAPPSETDLRRELLEQIGRELAGVVRQAFTTYRHQWVGELTHLSDREKIDRLARFVLLDPGERDTALERQLMSLSGFSDAPALLIRLHTLEPTLR